MVSGWEPVRDFLQKWDVDCDQALDLVLSNPAARKDLFSRIDGWDCPSDSVLLAGRFNPASVAMALLGAYKTAHS